MVGFFVNPSSAPRKKNAPARGAAVMKGISDTPKRGPSESVATAVARANPMEPSQSFIRTNKKSTPFGVPLVRMKGLEPIWSPTGT